MGRAKQLLNEHYKIVGLLLGIAIIFVDLLITNEVNIYYDSLDYWGMADRFNREGWFNYNIPTEETLFRIRGYAWPLMIAVFKTLGGGTQVGYWLVYSIFGALGLAYALPEFIETLFNKKVSWFGRIIPALLTVLFWNALIKYPLSDLPAVITVTFALLFLVKISDEQAYILNVLYAIMCGIMLGVSYYIRSGCKPIWIIAIIIILLYKYRKKYLKKCGLIILMCASIAITTIPQMMINTTCSGVKSYEVPIFLNSTVTQSAYSGGFQCLRYETDLTSIHPEEAIRAYDNVFDNILAAENLAAEDVTLPVLLGLFTKYPWEFLGLYATKFANCLDPRYGNQVFLSDLSSRQYGIMFFNFILWFMTFWGLSLQMNHKRQKEDCSQVENILIFMQKYMLYIIAFIFPALVHLAGTHIEARYFYACYALMYVYLGSLCPWREVFQLFKKKFLTVCVMAFALFGCLNAIWNFTFERFSYAQLLVDEPYVITQNGKEAFLTQDTRTQDVKYQIHVLEMQNDTYLVMQGFIYAKKKEADDSILELVLLGSDVEYTFEVNLTNDLQKKPKYRKSKFVIGEELAGLNNGKYEIGFILTNGEDKSVIFTGEHLEISKQ